MLEESFIQRKKKSTWWKRTGSVMLISVYSAKSGAGLTIMRPHPSSFFPASGPEAARTARSGPITSLCVGTSLAFSLSLSLCLTRWMDGKFFSFFCFFFVHVGLMVELCLWKRGVQMARVNARAFFNYPKSWALCADWNSVNFTRGFICSAGHDGSLPVNIE